MILEGVTRIDAKGTRALDERVGPGDERIDARGLLLVPGFIDLHAHLREPGFEDSETIATGAHAALRGGFTTVCAMANTDPAIDSPGAVNEAIARAAAAGGARVLPVAAITRGRKGTELADLLELAASGAVAFSDDGDPVEDAHLFRSALEYARSTKRPVFEHAQDRSLSAGGVMNEGRVSASLGLAGMPAAAEETAVARAIAIARTTGGRLHLQHVSTAASLEHVRRAKADGLEVTCEVTPHHLALSDEWVAGSRRFIWDEKPRDQVAPYESSTKVNPPLRTETDARALWGGLADGTVDAIATDHAPHASVRKDVEYSAAAFGISGLETALSLLLMGVDAGLGELETVIRALTDGPARVLARELGARDLVLIDPSAAWTVSADTLTSKGKNTPLLGMTLRGRAVMTFVDSKERYIDDAFREARASRRRPVRVG